MTTKNLFRFETILVLVLALEMAIFSKTGSNFATAANMFEVLRLSTEIGLLALVMTPIRGGLVGSGRLRSAAKRPAALSRFFNSSSCS